MTVSLPALAALLLSLAGAPAVLEPVSSATPPAAPRPAMAAVTVVQATPGMSVDVSIDGDQVLTAAGSGQVSKAIELPPGTHEVEFSDADADLDVTSSLVVEAGSRSDVVLHRPASVDGDPVVSSYATPTEPIGQGKARVLVAHTAVVPPADVRVDGQTVFTNIANGEFATADVPSGTHEVALLPTGSTRDPILGPLDLTVPQGTVTMVYAVGSPRNGSMDVILHSARLRPTRTSEPDTIKTGSAGLARAWVVRGFRSR
jgi:hypothetical protein